MNNPLYLAYRKIKAYLEALEYRHERRIRDKSFISIGRNVRYSPFESVILNYEKTSLGDNVFINMGAHFSGHISIGDDVLIGPYVYIINGDHGFTEIGKKIYQQKRQDDGTVTIGIDCWIGARTVITKAVTIGEGTIVGAASVVTRNLPPYCVCVGNPCKPKKKRYSDEELLTHLQLLGRTAEEAGALIDERNRLLAQFDCGPSNIEK